MTEPNPPTTIRRLLALKRGHAIVYYRGNLKDDIARAAAADGASNYAKLLCDIYATVSNLDRQGRVKLSEKKVDGRWPDRPGYVEYTAEGLS